VSEYAAKLAVKLGKDFGFMIDKPIMDLSRDFLFSKSDSVRNRMYPFQIKGLDFLHTTGGRAIIADEMGLGKTIEALGFIQERGFHSVLIISPASVTYKWQAEIKSWVNSDAVIITKGKDVLPDTTYTIMSYAIFTNKIEDIRLHGYQLAVFDECHYLANRDAARTRAAKSLATPYFLGLSGTPFLNKPIELFPQLNIISPGRWNSYWKFAQTYCDAHRERFGWVVDGASHLKELKEELKPYYLRRTKQEVLTELPSLTRVNIPVDYERELSRQYAEAIDVLRKKISIGEGKKLTKLALIAELRQIIGHMKVLPSIELAESVLTSKPKVVLFAHHKAVVAELETKLKQYNPIKIVGDTPQKERQDNVNAFLVDPRIRVAIISQAGGEGIDLYAADTLIFVEREWNPGKEGQIEARLHRIGQTSNVEVIYMIARGTIDERIHRMIEEKREIFGQLISIDDIPVLDILEITNER
jgi:SWI/SNF-related matrix-associated actin-dependent regulator 1 of chromatin subfamily A